METLLCLLCWFLYYAIGTLVAYGIIKVVEFFDRKN